MYISCDIVPNGGPAMESETGYVPNNPLFGLTLEGSQPECSDSCVGCLSCQGDATLPISPLADSDFDCDNCFEHNSISLCASQNLPQIGNLWNSDEMSSSFSSLGPLDMDPISNLFPFSPCGTSYNFPTPQASLSYSVHPSMIMSQNQTSSAQTAASQTPQCYYDSSCPQHTSSSMYPSMSVNVSMNMTMHGYGGESGVPLQYSQWTQNNPSPGVNVLYSPLRSPPSYNGAPTYSFSADFRSPNQTAMSNGLSSASNGLVPPSMKSPTISVNSPRNFYNTLTPPLTANTTSSPKRHSPEMQSSILDSKAYTTIEFEDEDGRDSESGDFKPNLCRLCGKTYARPSTLKTHLRTHSGERPYKCPDCNKSFSQAANLTAHVRTHTGQKPFNCPICDRRFSQSSSVTTHMRTHSGERPYRCSFCKKSFSDSSTLTKHLRIHSGEKPYQCKLCLLRFSQSGNLNRHMRIHGSSANVSL